MAVDLKIRLETGADGQQGVNPETMALLLEFGAHRQVCEDCSTYYDKQRGDYCATGRGLLDQILERPDVTYEKSK